jgi:hypothetical protein
MKKIFLISVLFLLIFLTSCSTGLIADTIPAPETVIVTETITVEDTAKIIELEQENSKLEAELAQYQSLISNLNDLLKNVYYVYQKKSDGSSVWGTGFSIEYNDKYFLITAGHAVKNEYGVFKNLGFKLDNKWVYPKLLAYDNDYTARNDYAIFYSNKINNGFIIDNENDNPEYILGTENQNLNIIRSFNINGIEGESGSPIIDYEGEIVGIDTTDLVSYYTEINKVLQAIDTIQ